MAAMGGFGVGVGGFVSGRRKRAGRGRRVNSGKGVCFGAGLMRLSDWLALVAHAGMGLGSRSRVGVGVCACETRRALVLAGCTTKPPRVGRVLGLVEGTGCSRHVAALLNDCFVQRRQR